MQIPQIPENEQERLNSLYQTGILDTPPEERFDRLTRLAKHIFGTSMALISIIDEKRQWFKSKQGIDASETSREISFCGHAILDKDIFQVPDATKDPRFSDNPLVVDEPKIRFYAGAPLNTFEGFQIGTLCIIDHKPRQLSEEELHVLRDLADLVEEEVNQFKILEQKKELQQAKMLNEVIKNVQSQFILDLDQRPVFDELLNNILKLTNSEYGFISEVRYSTNGDPYLKTYSVTNIAWNEETKKLYNDNVSQGMEFHNLKTLFGAALVSKQPVIANDPYNDSRRGGLPEGHPALNAFLGIPVHHSGAMIAMLGLANRPGGYTEKDLDFLNPLIVIIGQLVEAVRLRNQHNQSRSELSQFKKTLDQALDCVFMFDAENLNFFYVNEGSQQHVGYSREELLTMHPYDIKPDLDETQFREMIKPLLTKEKLLLIFETNHRHKDGHLIPVEIHLQYIDSDTESKRFVAIVRDIAERKKSELALKQERDFNSALFSAAGAIILVLDRKGRIIRFNHTAEQITGFQFNEVYEKNIWDLVIMPEEMHKVKSVFENLKTGNIVPRYENHWLMKDKTTRLFDWSNAVMTDPNGNVEYIVTIGVDITEKRKAEAKLLERERQLTEAQSLANIGNWEADIITGEINWSEEIYRIFGYEPSSFKPSVNAFHAAIHPEDIDHVHQSELLAEITGKHDVVHRIIRPDNTIRYLHELAQGELDSEGNLIRLKGTVQDITERVEFENNLIKARDEAEKANNAKSEFLSSMSHELRTPLNAIIGFGQLIQLEEDLSESQKENVKEILQAGDHLLNLINEILDLSKVESGHIQLSPEAFEVLPVIEECVSLINSLAIKKRVSIHLSGANNFIIQTDRIRLKQSVLNLLSNAVKYNNTNGSVEINILRQEKYLKIRICDTGPGIPADRLDQLFQPFYRMGIENSNIEGTGIGLTLTKKIVEQMEGKLEVESKPGKGSIFSILIPISDY